MPWTNFFDDYPAMAPAAIASNTLDTMVSLCNLLGFRFSGEKLSAFRPSATMLGVEVDCSRFEEGLVLVRNKPGRAEELVNALEGVLEAGFISRRRYLSLMGRLHYTDSHILGKSGRLFMADIRSWAKAQMSSDMRLDDTVRRSLSLFIERLRGGVPRQVPCGVADHVVHVFTDGASEGDQHTIGGVIMLEGRLHSFFGCEVPMKLVHMWSKSMMHWIGPVEAYAVAVARKIWHQHIASRRCIFYIDNLPALDAYVRGTAANVHVREILLAFEDSERLCASWAWFARVASFSNVSDDPSRAVVQPLVDAGCRRVSPSCPISGCDLRDLVAPAKIGKMG